MRRHHHADGLAASPQILSVVVAVLCFVIAAGFLLSLVPDPRRKAVATLEAAAAVPQGAGVAAEIRRPTPAARRSVRG